MKSGWLVGPLLGVLALIIFLVIPPIAPLTPLGMKVVGIFLFTVFWWVTVDLGYSSILCVVLFIVLGVMSPTEAFAASFGNWLIPFCIGTYGISDALRVTGFTRRFALWFVTRPFTAGRPWLLTSMFLLACTLLGGISSGAAACVVFMAIAEPMLVAMGYKKGDRFAATLMMGIGWAGTASFSMTPIAHAGAVMVMEWVKRDFGQSMNFVQWMAWGIPMGLLLFLLLMLAYRYLVRPDVSKISSVTGDFIRRAAGEIGPLSMEEKITIVVFVAVVVSWMLPGLASGVMPTVAHAFENWGYAVPPLVGTCLLCIIRVKNKPVFTFERWMRDGMDWQTFTLVASIMIIGEILGDPKTGIIEFLTNVFEPIAKSVPFMIFLMLTMTWVILQTNFMSNMVSRTLVYTVMAPIGVAMGGNAAALGLVIVAGSSIAFALPSATIVTAMVTGSGWVPVGFMAKYGFLMVIPVVLFYTFIGYPLACLIFR